MARCFLVFLLSCFVGLLSFLVGRVFRRIIGTRLSRRLTGHIGQDRVIQRFYISSLLRSVLPSVCCQPLELCITIKNGAREMRHLWPNKSPEPTPITLSVPLSRLAVSAASLTAFHVR